MDKSLHEPIYQNNGNYGNMLYLGHAGFCTSAIMSRDLEALGPHRCSLANKTQDVLKLSPGAKPTCRIMGLSN